MPGSGVSLLRWGTGSKTHACALLVRDPSTGQEVERPYHEGMQQLLPERFKVKFVARMLATPDPIAGIPPGRSFLFLHPYKSKGSMLLLGVVEAVRLVERAKNPTHVPHIYHLDVRRVQGQGQGGEGIVHPGIQSDVAVALRNTLVQHFGVAVAQANAVPAMLDQKCARFVLHFPGGTPRMPA